MKTVIFIFLIVGLFFYGCNKHSGSVEKEDEYLKAKVFLTSDVSCYIPVLDFTEDSVKVRRLTNTAAIRYSVIKLPTNLNVLNNTLYVRVSALTPAEEFPCNTLGIPYPHLKVTDAKIR